MQTELFFFLERTYVRLSDHPFRKDKNREKGWTQFNHGRITCFQRKLCTVDVGFTDRLITTIYFLQ